MAFISILIIFFVLGLSFICFLGLVISILLAIVFAKRKSTHARVLKIISIVTAGICVVGLLPAGLFGGYVVLYQTSVPSDFVACDVTATLTENGFVTSDGQEFRELPYTHYRIKNEKAAFSVKPEGLFNRCNWNNIDLILVDGLTLYFYVENFASSGVAYCTAAEYDRVSAYFAENRVWTKYWSENVTDATVLGIIEKYKAMPNATENTRGFIDCEEVHMACVSRDEMLLLDECWFVAYEDAVYIHTYYIIEDYYYYYGFVLTEEEATLIREFFFAAE